MAVVKQTGQASGAVSDVNRAGRMPGGRQASAPDVDASPLQTVAAGILGGVSPMQLMSGIDAANRGLGNRSFLHWVGALRSGGHEAVTGSKLCAKVYPCKNRGGEQGAPLQMMGRKKKKPGAGSSDELQGHAGAGKTRDAGAGPDKEEAPEPVAAQPQLPGPSPKLEPGPGVMSSQAGAQETAPAQKKKKKSRVQVALNTLRDEGVEAFGRYIEAEIGEAALLGTLVERINRAENLGDVRAAALARVEARLRLLDSEEVAKVTGAVAPAQGLPPVLSQSLPLRLQAEEQAPHGLSEGQELERPVCAPVKYGLNLREEELFYACVHGETGRFKRRLRQVNVDVNIANNYGTLLVNATYYASVNIVKELLSRPEIDVNLATPVGATPLYIATQGNHAEVVKLLLGHTGINVNLATLHGITPLHMAAQYNHAEVAKLLLAAPGIKVDLRRPNGATALYTAVQANFPGIVEQLVRRGADANLALLDGKTPLYLAARRGYLEVVRILLHAPGIRVKHETGERLHPLEAAALQGHKDIVRLLLRNGADPNIKSSTGFTPLHVACVAGNTAIVEMLLQSGADPEVEAGEPGRVGQTACDLAELEGHREVASILKAHRRRREAASSRLEPPPVPGTEAETDAAQ